MTSDLRNGDNLPVPDPDFSALQRALRGEVLFDATTRGLYATDASVYQVTPLAVAFPQDADDCRKIMAFCRDRGVPVIGRGGGTSLSGQAIGPGLVIDFSRHMNRVLEVATDGTWARVEPGVVLDELNQLLAPHGTHFAPDPATGSRATIGGMIGNNSCGTRSIVYGRTSDSIRSLHLLLTDGTELVTPRMDAAQWARQGEGEGREHEICRKITTLVGTHRAEIAARFPNLPRVVAGYALNTLIADTPARSLSDLICGSEGTLALVLEATLRLTPLPAATALVVIGFDSLESALQPLRTLLDFKPSAIELLDEVIITEALRNHSTRDLAAFLLASGRAPTAVLLCEFFDHATARTFAATCQEQGIGSSLHLCLDQAAQHRAWEVRRLGLGLISNQPGRQKGVAVIEDACVPVEKLAEYTRFVYAACARHGVRTATYAHASVGVLHFKAMLDLHEEPDRKALRALSEECFAECLRLGGVFSGEHGDGIVRGEFVEKQFGPVLYQAFREIKSLFDPHGLMNPGRKLDALPMDGPLRYGDTGKDGISWGGAPADYPQRVARVPGLFHYRGQGGLAGAIEQCNGVAACRKLGSGNMCPSYRVTRDEAHSTRGRANALRLALTGQLGGRHLADPGLHEALDLCLACKACQAECPNAVDLARLKSEALQARWDIDGVTPGACLIGDLPTRAAQFAGTWLGEIGARLAGSTLGRRFMESRYGIDQRRALPRLASRTLEQRLQRGGWADGRTGRRVALFADTWMRYFEPQIGLAAVELLESCGFAVILTTHHDSQRTRLSAGLVREAKTHGTALFNELRAFADQGIPVVCIEPSDCSAITDDLPDLLDEADAGAVAGNVRLLDDFLVEQLAAGLKLRPTPGAAGSTLLHPHCHQRALFSAAAPKKILEAAGFTVDAPETGCCGMAGSFGYTHHALSEKVGEERLFPAARAALAAGRRIVATGTSCRQQLRDFLHVEAVHWVELVRGQR